MSTFSRELATAIRAVLPSVGEGDGAIPIVYEATSQASARVDSNSPVRVSVHCSTPIPNYVERLAGPINSSGAIIVVATTDVLAEEVVWSLQDVLIRVDFDYRGAGWSVSLADEFVDVTPQETTWICVMELEVIGNPSA